MRKRPSFWWGILLWTGAAFPLTGQVKYPYRFNPEEGMVKAPEKPYRQELCLNGTWQFMPLFTRDTAALRLPSAFQWSDTPIRIPSPWNVNTFARGNGDNFVTFPSYPEAWNKASVGWMRKVFTVPSSFKGKELFLHFEAVAGHAVYYLNHRKIGEHFDLFFPYEMDITPFLKPGKNELLVAVAAPDLYDQRGRYGRRTYVAGSFWGTSMRGIWQDVYLEARPKIEISGVYVRPQVDRDSLRVDVTLKNETSREATVSVSGVVRPWQNLAGKDVNEAPVEKGSLGREVLDYGAARKVRVPPGGTAQLTLARQVAGRLAPWTPDTPRLYGLVLSIRTKGDTADKKYTRFGWRQFTIQKDHLLLNGRIIRLKGDSWHFMGVPEMTRRYAWAWFKVLKDAHANAVRLHAEPYPRFFLDVADEMGICVLDESGIWASDGGPKMDSPVFWASCDTHIRRLVMRDRNHPSVFGWSVSNETIPVAVNVFHAPDTLVHHLLGAINHWADLVRQLDPTRPWISGDGETQFEDQLDLPTIVGHYGDRHAMTHWSGEGKPWGIGEQGMAYYGTPKQVSVYNGNRAFVSQEGRTEGLAIEAYQLLRAQQELGASYSSVFNIVWYGLKPLPLGLGNTSRPPMLSDGIYFTDYQEGVPGMQPERLGPYTTTLNPGYDPKRPLYAPWPLFEAVKAADRDPPAPFSISPDSTATPVDFPAFKPEKRKVVLLGPPETPLFAALKAWGLRVSGQTPGEGPVLAIVDGQHPPLDTASAGRLREIAAWGGRVLVLGVSEASLDALNRLLPDSLALTDRVATSFVKCRNVPALSGLGNSDFYFTELLKQPVMTHGMAGPFVSGGETLLAACGTDWSRWNYRPEYAKTAAVAESEAEAKPAGDALVYHRFGKGGFLVTTLDLSLLEDHAKGLVMQLLSNLGATFNAGADTALSVLSPDGDLTTALVAGTYDTHGMTPEEVRTHDFTGKGNDIRPVAGDLSNGRYWQTTQADSLEVFELGRLPLTGPKQHAVAYLSFWVYSPRSLVNLLAEPDMPSLSLALRADDGCAVALNGRELGTFAGQARISHVPLAKGWNHFLVKVMQNEGAWRFSARFESDHPGFVRSLGAALAE